MRARVPEGHEENGAEASDGRKATQRLVLKLAMDEGARAGTPMLVLKLNDGRKCPNGHGNAGAELGHGLKLP